MLANKEVFEQFEWEMKENIKRLSAIPPNDRTHGDIANYELSETIGKMVECCKPVWSAKHLPFLKIESVLLTAFLRLAESKESDS